MRMPVRIMLIGGLLYALEFIFFLIGMWMEWPAGQQVIFALIGLSVSMAVFLIAVHRIHAPLQQFVIAAGNHYKEMGHGSPMPVEVREFSRVLEEEATQNAGRLQEMKAELDRLASTRTTEQRYWRRYQTWSLQNRDGLEAASAHQHEAGVAGAELSECILQLLIRVDRVKTIRDELYAMVSDAARRISEIRESQDKRVLRVHQLLRRFVDIRDVMKRIHMITDQTKIISFNAGIEASSTVDAGKRFSIVAADMRKLAQNIGDAYQEIKEVVIEMQIELEDITTGAREGIEYTDKTKEGLESAVLHIDRLGELSAGCANDIGVVQAIGGQIRDLTAQTIAQLKVCEGAEQEIRNILQAMPHETESSAPIHLTDRLTP